MGLAIMSTVMFFIIGIMLVNVLMSEVTSGRLNLSCSAADSISDGTKLLCLVLDGIIPYMIVTVLAVAVGFITDKLL